MHLVGQLSNPSGPLEAVFETLPDRPISTTARPEPQPASGRLGNGVVQRAVANVLATAGLPMCSAEVHARVEHLLGHPVSKNSVSWCLAAGTRAQNPRFVRTAPGWYRQWDATSP
jgi:hypothetical protein